MAETAAAPVETPAATPAAEGGNKEFTQPVKAGTPVAWKPAPESAKANNGVVDNNAGKPADPPAGGENQQQQQQPANTPADNAGKPADPPAPVEISDEQLKAHFDRLGIPFENMEALKTKLTAPAEAPAELTPEQKADVEKKKEDRMVKEHLAQKRSVEEYASLKQILAIDKKVLGMEKEINDLIKEG